MAALACGLALACSPAEESEPARAEGSAQSGGWASYAADPQATKYSPLAEIDGSNFASLKVAWTWTSADVAWLRDVFPTLRHPAPPGGKAGVMNFTERPPNLGNFQGTPILLEGRLHGSTSMGQVYALDAATGETLWVHDPKSYLDASGAYFFSWNPKHRGVAAWQAGGAPRIFMTAIDAYLVALDAATGEPIPGFGDAGRVDLLVGLRRDRIQRVRDYFQSSPPLVIGDTVIVGSSIFDRPHGPRDIPGDVRGYDARTGALRWTFHVIPEAGEPGVETWEDGSFAEAGAANAWGPLAGDPEAGLVYVPTSTATSDFYGGHRKGDNLYAETLLCLDARTGERRWHRQLIHHGVWDYDVPAPPNVVDVTVGGKRVAAVAQVTKQGFAFVFDRYDGTPLWPIEERPAPPSDVPGERVARTQPVPTRPPPFERQGTFERDLASFTPEIRAAAREIFGRFRSGPLFVPPSREGTITLPGPQGGASWQGAGFDPESGRLFVPSVTEPIVLALEDGRRGMTRFDWIRKWVSLPRIGADGEPSHAHDALPLFQPPYSRITALDLNEGERVWQVANGEGPRDHPLLRGLDAVPSLGSGARTCVLVTKTVLVAGDGGDARFPHRGEPILRAYDKATGAVLATLPLPGKVMGCPMTYEAGGRQLLVLPVADPEAPDGGRPQLVALALR